MVDGESLVLDQPAAFVRERVEGHALEMPERGQVRYGAVERHAGGVFGARHPDGERVVPPERQTLDAGALGAREGPHAEVQRVDVVEDEAVQGVEQVLGFPAELARDEAGGLRGGDGGGGVSRRGGAGVCFLTGCCGAGGGGSWGG